MHILVYRTEKVSEQLEYFCPLDQFHLKEFIRKNGFIFSIRPNSMLSLSRTRFPLFHSIQSKMNYLNLAEAHSF